MIYSLFPYTECVELAVRFSYTLGSKFKDQTSDLRLFVAMN